MTRVEIRAVLQVPAFDAEAMGGKSSVVEGGEEMDGRVEWGRQSEMNSTPLPVIRPT